MNIFPDINGMYAYILRYALKTFVKFDYAWRRQLHVLLQVYSGHQEGLWTFIRIGRVS